EFSAERASYLGDSQRRIAMPKHKLGTRHEWKAAVEAVHERERELGRLDEEIAKQRQDVPWVPVEKEYVFDAEEGKKTLPELFDGRSQLLIYHLMFGPTYEAACAGCTGLADHLDGALPHLNARDITLIAISRAPDRFLLAPFYDQLLDQVPEGRDRDFPLRRHDEY